MTITQTVDISADRRTVDVPSEIPSGLTIISFTPISPKNPDNGKIRLTKEMKERLLQGEKLRSLTGILHTEMSIEEIREERLAKHLK